MHEFITVSPPPSGQLQQNYGSTKRISIQEVFNTKNPRDEVYVLLVATGSRYRVTRP